MAQQTPVQTKKSLYPKDLLIVCSVLTLFGICALCLTGGAAWGWGQRNKAMSANATSTASGLATLQAYATGTAVVRLAEQASLTEQANLTATALALPTEQPEHTFVDNFDDNDEDWLTETTNDEYMRGSIAIRGGLYVWEMREVKQPFVYWSNFNRVKQIEDFDMYVDTKIAGEAPGDACSGFVFRTASLDWEKGAYTFSVCSDAYFSVDYYEKGNWDPIDWGEADAFKPNDWNRLEIRARADHFTFLVNDEVILETTDDRLAKGGLALLVEAKEQRSPHPLTIWFDNFGFQNR